MLNKQADQTEYIVLGISLIITSLFGYLGYIEYGENQKLLNQISSETESLNTQEQEVNQLRNRLANASYVLGWRSRYVQVTSMNEEEHGKLEGYPTINTLDDNNRITEYTRSLMERKGFSKEKINEETASPQKARTFLTKYYESNLQRTVASLSDEVAIARDLNYSHALIPILDHTPVSLGTLGTHQNNNKKWSIIEPDNGIQELTKSSSSPGTTLKEALDEYVRIRNKLASELDQLESEISQTRQTFYSYVSGFGDEAQISSFKTESEQKINSLQNQVQDLINSVQEKQSQLVRIQGESDQKQYQKRRDKSRLLDQNNRDLIKKKRQIQKFEHRLKQLKDKKSETETKPDAVDGQVLSANQNASVAFIDIGRSHGLFVGREFEVFDTLKGGREIVKGQIKVVELFDDYARAEIVSQQSPRNDPISSSDFVRSDEFSRGQTKSFVFVGTFSGDYNKTVLKQMVLDNGHQIKQEVSINTDYLVIGDGYKQHPTYKKAQELNVNTISSSSLKHLFNKD